MRSRPCLEPGFHDVSYCKTISACRLLPSIGSSSWPRQRRMTKLLGLHVAAEVDIRAVGLLFYLTGASRTVSEALDNLARYSRTTNEALVAEISRQADEVILAIHRVEEFDEPHRQFFELLALWFIRTLHKETNRDFTLLRVSFTVSTR